MVVVVAWAGKSEEEQQHVPCFFSFCFFYPSNVPFILTEYPKTRPKMEIGMESKKDDFKNTKQKGAL